MSALTAKVCSLGFLKLSSVPFLVDDPCQGHVALHLCRV